MTGFEMISTGGESLSEAGTTRRAGSGQRQVPGRNTSESGVEAFAGILAAASVASAATPVADSGPKTDVTTTDEAVPEVSETGSMSESTVSAAVKAPVDSTGEGSADLSTDSAGEGAHKVSGQAPTATGGDAGATTVERSAAVAVKFGGRDLGKTFTVTTGTPPEAVETLNLQTAVPAGTAGGGGAMDQIGTGVVPAGVAPAADSMVEISGTVLGANSAPGGDALTENVMVRGVRLGVPSGQDVDAGGLNASGAQGPNQASAAALPASVGSDQSTEVKPLVTGAEAEQAVIAPIEMAQTEVAQTAADHPSIAQEPLGQSSPAPSVTTTSMATGSSTSPQAAFFNEAKCEEATGEPAVATFLTDQASGKEASATGNQPIDLQTAVKTERDGGSVQVQATTSSIAAASQTTEGSAQRMVEAGDSEGSLKQVAAQIKPGVASAPSVAVEVQAESGLSQMTEDGGGATGSFAGRQENRGAGESRESEAVDGVGPSYAWAPDGSRTSEMGTALPVGGEAARQTARVELKDLPQFVRKAELVATSGGPTEMRVQLVPENLGRMSVHISVTQGAVSAHLVVESPEVKALVEQRLPELEQSLREQGLQLSGLSVGCQDSGNREGALLRDQQQTGWTGRNQQSVGNARREYEESPLGVAEPIPAGSPSSVAGFASSSAP